MPSLRRPSLLAPPLLDGRRGRPSSRCSGRGEARSVPQCPSLSSPPHPVALGSPPQTGRLLTTCGSAGDAFTEVRKREYTVEVGIGVEAMESGDLLLAAGYGFADQHPLDRAGNAWVVPVSEGWHQRAPGTRRDALEVAQLAQTGRPASAPECRRRRHSRMRSSSLRTRLLRVP